MKKAINYILIVVFIMLLFLIRAYESELFYDPLIVYFQNDYLYSKIPELHIWNFFVDIFFRYVLNSLLTLGIIYLAFNQKKYVKFTSFFLLFAFLLLIVIFVYLLKQEFKHGYLFPFYIRRFLIHPLFLLVLIHAFYYMKKSTN